MYFVNEGKNYYQKLISYCGLGLIFVTKTENVFYANQ